MLECSHHLPAIRALLVEQGVFVRQGTECEARGGLRAVLGAQNDLGPLSKEATASVQAATTMHRAAAAAGATAAAAAVAVETKMEGRTIAELTTQLEAANERIAALEAAAAAAETNSGGGNPPPPVRNVAWDEKSDPLYEVMMGTENMGPMLYSVIRFAKVSRPNP